MQLLTDIIILFVLVLLSAFFSGTELAFFSLGDAKVRALVRKKVKNAEKLERLKSRPQRLLITILIGNNLVNISASVIAAEIAIRLFGGYGAGIAVGVMTFVLLVFGEITPKAYATRNAESIALATAPLLLFFRDILFMPIVVFLAWINRGILYNVKSKTSASTPEDEVIAIMDKIAEQHPKKFKERELVQNIFRLDDKEAKEVMTPINDVLSVKVRDTVKDIVEYSIQTEFSRFPVYDTENNRIVGVVHIKDLLRAYRHPEQKARPLNRRMMRKPFFIPEGMKIDSLMRRFQRRKEHLAIAVDEYGAPTGIITLEDLLEEIVGEIYDEFDSEEKHIRKLNAYAAIIEGNARIQAVNKELGLKLTEKDAFDTIGGYVLDKIGRIPEKGELLEFEQIKVKILRREGSRIMRMRVIKKMRHNGKKSRKDS